jgi:hemolysin activation/secretion protein
VNQLVGDNRFVANCELRFFPGWKWWALGFSGVAFYDMGSVWNQGNQLGQIRFHHSIGLGVRIHNLKSSGADAIFRFDFAYNLDENRFAGLVFSTNQLFSAFGNHSYKVPDMLGREIDLQ